MRIYVRTDEGKVFHVPAPMWLLKLGTGRLAEKIIHKYVPEKDRKYIDCIDLKQVRSALDMLKKYKGLEIVHVESKDGTKVSIKV